MTGESPLMFTHLGIPQPQRVALLPSVGLIPTKKHTTIGAKRYAIDPIRMAP